MGRSLRGDRLASLTTLCRTLRLCSEPCAVNAGVSLRQLRYECLYAHVGYDVVEAG
jgi:hypothetical protein